MTVADRGFDRRLCVTMCRTPLLQNHNRSWAKEQWIGWATMITELGVAAPPAHVVK
jgi:hypothetical protein